METRKIIAVVALSLYSLWCASDSPPPTLNKKVLRVGRLIDSKGKVSRPGAIQGDQPVPADYDGDGLTNGAVNR